MEIYQKNLDKLNRSGKGQGGHLSPGVAAGLRTELTELGEAIFEIESPKEISNFFKDLCTPSEWKAICDRWLVAQLVSQGISYRKIYELTGVSTATITRVGRALNEGSGYQGLFRKLMDKSGS